MGMCKRDILLLLLTVHTHGSAEAAIALRQRLNETVDQLDVLRKEHAELEVKFDSLTKELTIAKSDCKSIELLRREDQIQII